MLVESKQQKQINCILDLCGKRMRAVMPDNKKRQLEIIYKLIALQSGVSDPDEEQVLKKDLKELMVKRDAAKRKMFVRLMIQSITKRAPFITLRGDHFYQMKDAGISLEEIACYYKLMESAVEEKLGIEGVKKWSIKADASGYFLCSLYT
ncbi:hypothetical protein [Listeria booriae]|uniref:Uncharacterized protein n=1 Tax=Listeria booriae TaxID=1552123 RepID=A0A842FYU3_9LIST|nr:hypothetical protein [Listeria booriae]MBC2292969.1 hypothetical protein [Listeria booriae]MBC2676259.1 hypothetical protein [Listeria booriae]MBC6151072.1 hypothetical protein [Listeria booriae]MBC6151179.1 hypothetical protein [Listeria booriae]